MGRLRKGVKLTDIPLPGEERCPRCGGLLALIGTAHLYEDVKTSTLNREAAMRHLLVC
jgi:hypothetical protein